MASSPPARLEFLTLLSGPKRAEVLEGATTAQVPMGSIFYKEGQGDRVFIVNRGIIRAFYTGRDGRQATAVFAHRGQALGLAALLGSNPNFSGQAVMDSEWISPNTGRLRELAHADPELSIAVARYLAGLLRNSYRFSTLRALGDMRQKLAYDLLERCCNQLSQTRKLEVKVTHQELALSVGTSREVITRAMAMLRSSHLIESSPNHVRITNPDGLYRVIAEFVSSPI